MKTKKITFFTFFVFLSAGIVLFFTGCEQDYYDPSRQQGTGSSLFGDSIDVPATFDWATTRNIDMRVEVEDNYNGAYHYTVEIFDANPLFDEEATLLGMGVAKNNSDFITEVVLPDAVNMVYIQQTSPTGGKTIAPVEVSATAINYSFSNIVAAASSTAALRSSSAEEVNDGAVSSRSSSTVYSVPSVITAITQTNGRLELNLDGGPYLIDGSFNGTTHFWGKGDIYVTGTFHVTDKFKLPSDSKLIILEGGSVEADRDVEILANSNLYNNGTISVSGKLQTSNANALVVNNHIMSLHKLEITQQTGLFENYGSLTVEDDILIANVSGKLINHNTIITNSLSLNNGIFHNNNGDILVQGHTKATSASAIIINDGSFVTQTMGLQGNKAQVENNCHMIVEGLLNTTDASIIVGSGGLLSTANLFMENTRIELGSAAMMKVTVEAVFKNNTGSNGFFGTGGNKALLQIAKAVADKKNEKKEIIYYQGNLEIECYDHPSKYINDWTGEGVTWAGEGGSTLVIPGTECNDGGYSNVPSTPPSNPVFPIIWNGTDVTYMFEDNWPLLGDYDMNDVVLNMKPEYTIDAGNKVTQLKLDVTLRAVGGVKRLAVGMQIDGMARNVVSSVSRSSQAGRDNSVFSASNGLETGQDYVVIPIFDDVHKALGIPAGTMVNTTVGGSIGTVSPAVVTFTLTFNSPVDRETVSIDKLNPFIVNGGYNNSRHEVHLPGFAPTDKTDIRRFGAGDDDSNNKYYTSKGNLIWALAIPGTTRYPKEYTSIRKAYPQIESWATTSGQSDKDWYMHPVQTFIYNK